MMHCARLRGFDPHGRDWANLPARNTDVLILTSAAFQSNRHLHVGLGGLPQFAHENDAPGVSLRRDCSRCSCRSANQPSSGEVSRLGGIRDALRISFFIARWFAQWRLILQTSAYPYPGRSALPHRRPYRTFDGDRLQSERRLGLGCLLIHRCLKARSGRPVEDLKKCRQ